MQTETVLVIEDDAELRRLYADALTGAGFTVVDVASAAEALDLLSRPGPGLVLCDQCLGGMSGLELLREMGKRSIDVPLLMISGSTDVRQAVDALRLGAVDFLVKPISVKDLVTAVKSHIEISLPGIDTPVAADKRSLSLLDLARRAAQSDASVLITGPSGVGKEVIARFVHTRSARARKDFIAINCAAIPASMLEATLFGHDKGAFTGANRTMPGKFEQANGGTVLLDEISEMGIDLQAKLLRVLQERVVERLGGDRQIELDVRIIATSNRDLPAEVAAGQFRQDLYFRLNVFPLHLLPLNERKGDILPLARTALGRLGSRGSFSEPAQRELVEHPWPGNVRELENLVHRAYILAGEQDIEAWHLQFDQFPDRAEPAKFADREFATMSSGGLRNCLRDQEQRRLMEAIGNTGTRKAAAQFLGISERTLRYKLARLRDQGVQVPLARQA